MWYPVAGTTVPYLRNCGTRLLEQWCNSGRNLHNELEIENHYYMKDAHMHFVDVVCNDSELKKLRKKLSEDGEYSIRKLTSGEYKFMCGCPSWESADEI